ncbi:Aste57867_18216 [Aphanomyces stellatus]|uniref:Tetratricopeptide repeat protein 38 n=1 Tax=Aphanomyces stellatus TaxID=120398 RepID=A0A485L9H3_9STRA|nr:hypothetical protein As57867_018154 [Aphanomyces stellatus]VFT94954.1 Aste57867_18216 [Aphanomyces stellatus]
MFLLAARRSRAAAQRILPSKAVTATRSMSFLDQIFSYGEKPSAPAVAGSSGFQLALLGYISLTMCPVDSLQAILKKDPSFLMGHILVGASEYLHPRLHSESLDAPRRLATAKSLLDQASAPEKLHVRALDALVSGRFREASLIYETLLREDCTDLLALKCAFDVYSILGDKRNMLDTISRVLPQLPSSHPGYSHVLALQAFGLQERGDFAAAESLANRAMSMNDEDAGAFHALLHIYECQGKHQDGSSVVMRHQDAWSTFSVLRSHVYIHWIFFLIETGRFDRVLQLLKNEVFVPNELLSANVLSDLTQVYWRLRFAGYDTPDILADLDGQWQAVISDVGAVPLTPLAALHAHVRGLNPSYLPTTMSQSITSLARPQEASLLPVQSASAFTSNAAALEAELGTRVLPFSHGLPGQVELDVIATLKDALTAYGKGQYNDVVEKLLAVRGLVHVVGGSLVEAEMFEILLIDAARCSSQFDVARLILNERINVKPQSAQYWKTYGDILEELHDEEGVDGARRMSYVLGLGQAGTSAA